LVYAQLYRAPTNTLMPNASASTCFYGIIQRAQCSDLREVLYIQAASAIAFATGDSSVITQLATQLRITISNEIRKTRALSIVVSAG